MVGDSVARPRHLAVADNGDLFVALASGGFMVLRDSDADGIADVQRHFDGDGATGIALQDGYLYFAPDDRVVRYPWDDGALEPAGEPEIIAGELLSERNWHSSKGFAIGPDSDLFVNIGVPSNVCMQSPREAGQVGQDPCPLLENSGGIWRFDAKRVGQTQADGERFATGLRNTFALTIHPETGELFGVQHGRDGLAQYWPDLYTTEESAEKPAEEFVRIARGQDYGWPYCYFDRELQLKVLAPEYGGDGETQGRCAEKAIPVLGFPGHWAPEAVLFYTGDQFPEEYHGGAFVSFHGSWNRAPEPQAGYNVAFVPFQGNEPLADYTVFADGFAGETVSPGEAAHRPMGLAVGPDGSLYVGDDQAGRIYRIVYTGE
jgi:glucose/arabinose dehydrogenase